ncbi:MAG TPA: helix-turn-helix domain-containing protein [Dehalococcoidia bacterium]|nr:helix-turn-helix domain-containing protein [Dehalococcoidia bacterium]
MIGDRWSMLLLRDLYFGYSRFNELLEHSPGLSTKTLTERLRALEQHGLVERRIYSEKPLRYSYHLTELGKTLEPVIGAIYQWGMEHAVRPDERSLVERRRRRNEERGAQAAGRDARV